MHKRVSVFDRKSSHFQRVSVFYKDLDQLFSQKGALNRPFIKAALTEWWASRFPAPKKSGNAEPTDKLSATLKKLYAYLDRLNPELRQDVCQAIHEHVGLHPENSLARNYLLLDMPHPTGRECIAAQAFRAYLQHEIWTDHAHVAVFEKLNVAAKVQGFARIAEMRGILAADPEIAARLKLGLSLFDHMGLDAQSLSSAFRGSDAEPGFLRGTTRETVDVLLRHFSLVFSEASLTASILGDHPTPQLEEAFLALWQLPITPAQLGLLKTINEPITLLSHADYLDSEALSGVATALKFLDTTIHRGYDNRDALIALIIDHVLCPDAKPPLSTLMFAKNLDIEYVQRISNTLTDMGLKEHSFSFSQKLLFAQIALREISDIPDMSYFEIQGEHPEGHASRTSGLSRSASKRIKPVRQTSLFSRVSTASDQVSERPIQQGLVRHSAIRGAGFGSDDEFSVASEASTVSLTPSEQGFYNSLLAKRERIEDRIRNEVMTYNQARKDRVGFFDISNKEYIVFFEELICFLRDMCLPSAFTNDLSEPFARTLGVAKNFHIIREAAHAITEKCNLNPTQQKEAQRTLDTVFGKQASDPFEATPWALSVKSFVSASELRFLFGLPTLPTKVDNAQKMYRALFALVSLENRHDFTTICQAMNLSGEEAVSQRLSTVGHHVSDLLLSKGLTTVETQALTKLRKFYGEAHFRTFIRDGVLSAAIGLTPKEGVALRSLLSQDHSSFKLVLDIFVYSGHGARFHVDSGYQLAIPVISSLTVAQDALRLRNVHLQIYEAALNDLLTRQMGNDDRGRILHEISVVQRDIGTPLMVEDLSRPAKATKASLKSSLGKKGNLAGTRKRMTALLSQMVSDELRAISPKEFLQKYTETRLNTQNRWGTKRFDVGDTTSVITPANAAASGKFRNCVMDARGYTGISCQSNATREDAAANNQMTALLYDGAPIFSGVRHAIVATEIDDIVQKNQANDAKAKDLLRSAILQKLMTKGIPSDGKLLTSDGKLLIHLVSISLVTPDDVRPYISSESETHHYHEREMLQEQTAALQRLKRLSLQDKEALLSEFQTSEGQPVFDAGVSLEIDVHLFNFGVNEGELGGRDNQRRMNAAAMDTFLILVRQLSFDSPKDGVVEALRFEIERLFQNYQALGLTSGKQPQPYAMPVMIAALAQLVDASLLFNCKSGKDRTSLFDVKVKIFMRYLETRGESESLLYFDRLESAYAAAAAGLDTTETSWLREQQRFNRTMLFNAGNREVQEENTTAWVYKLEGENTARMFDVVFGIKNMAEVYGFSQLIEA